MVKKYNVKATGLGSGWNNYPLDFDFTSNYDMDKDDYEYERVVSQAHNQIRLKSFKSFTNVKITKI